MKFILKRINAFFDKIIDFMTKDFVYQDPKTGVVHETKLNQFVDDETAKKILSHPKLAKKKK